MSGCEDRPDEDVPRQCKRADGAQWAWKVRFDTRDEAVASHKGLQAYQCWYCNFWHLGHGPKEAAWQIKTIRPPRWRVLGGAA